jgi:alpha-ketoglutarate-dependent taurine dioxygenase
MFDILPPELKSLAVRTSVRYAPHPYVWMAPAKAMSTGLGIESDGLELDKEKDLPMWEESKIKTFPMLWKNPKTGKLHFQVHPCGAEALVVAPLPTSVRNDKALYPDGATIEDLKEVREILYNMQRPAIAPKYVYPHDWEEGDLCLFHNRGALHTVVGAFKEDQVRSFWQCNLASGDAPVGPSEEDIIQYS